MLFYIDLCYNNNVEIYEVTKPTKIVLIEVTKPTKIVLIEADLVSVFILGDIHMIWIDVNANYLDYLRKFEDRIPKTDYGENKYKPFFGVLFEAEDLCYITQVSHPQLRHNKLKNQLDFYKIYDPKKLNRLIAVVNLNYMFPIPKSEIYPVTVSNIEQHRTFKSDKEKSQYVDLLKREMKYIDTLNLPEKAKKIYNLKYNHPTNKISVRCIDFKRMEHLAHDYILTLDERLKGFQGQYTFKEADFGKPVGNEIW